MAYLNALVGLILVGAYILSTFTLAVDPAVDYNPVNSWRRPYIQLFGQRIQEQNTRMKVKEARRLMDELKESLKLPYSTIPRSLRREAQYWIEASELNVKKCTGRFEAELWKRYAVLKIRNGRTDINLKIYIDDLILRLVEYCMNSPIAADLLHSIKNIPESTRKTLRSFRFDDEVEYVDAEKVADYLAAHFNVLWPGDSPDADEEYFKKIYLNELTALCKDVVVPIVKFADLLSFIKSKQSEHKLDPHIRDWLQIVKQCQFFKGDKHISGRVFDYFPEAVTRYQYYVAPVREKSQLGLDNVSEDSWKYLYTQLFTAAKDDIIKPLNTDESIALLRKLGDKLKDKNEDIPTEQRELVEFWVNLENKMQYMACDADLDSWYSYHMTKGLPGVGFIPCNFKVVVEYMRRKHFDTCTRSKEYRGLMASITRIPAEDITLIKSIKPIGTYGGGISVDKATKYLAKLYISTEDPSRPLDKIHVHKFTDLYRTEIFDKCGPIAKIKLKYHDLAEYMMNRFFENQIDQVVRNWYVAAKACEMLITEEYDAINLLYESFPRAISKLLKGGFFTQPQ